MRGEEGGGPGAVSGFAGPGPQAPSPLAGLPPAPPSGRVEPGCWVPEGKAEGEGEGKRCMQDKSYLALPHRQGSHRAVSPRTELLEAVFLAWVMKITAQMTHYLAHPKLHSISPLSWGEAMASGSDSRTLSSRELQKSSQPYCNFLFPVLNALSTCPLCCTCARGLLSAGPGLQLFLPPPPTRTPQKGPFWRWDTYLVHTVLQLTGARSQILERQRGRATHPNSPLGSFHSLTGTVRPPAHPYSSLAFSRPPHRPLPTWP